MSAISRSAAFRFFDRFELVESMTALKRGHHRHADGKGEQPRFFEDKHAGGDLPEIHGLVKLSALFPHLPPCEIFLATPVSKIWKAEKLSCLPIAKTRDAHCGQRVSFRFAVDKMPQFPDRPWQMQICLKYARMFWVLAVLFMASGQIAHAYQDSSCATQHASERQKSDSKQQPDCPAGHSCCNSHSHILGALAEAPAYAFVALASGSFQDHGDTVVEGPIAEIDYPPQLS
ncbi:MAG: hypothetical protein J0I10_01200 [Verrucomicrobia bacterium]|nr:hypothetical protein [Verrucomicrobiota bacterium]